MKEKKRKGGIGKESNPKTRKIGNSEKKGGNDVGEKEE